MSKHNYLLVLLLLFMASTVHVKAESVSPYHVDFNTSIATSDHDFKVASGWGHIVDYLAATYVAEAVYVSYSYAPSNGVDNSGALRIGSQGLYNDDYDSKDATDLLVSPKVSGTVTVAVAKSTEYSTSKISFYSVSKKEDGSYAVGEKLSTEAELNYGEYKVVTIKTDANNEYIGIQGSNVYIDNFTATSADIVKQKGLTVTGQMGVKTAPDATADGKFPVILEVTVSNTGDIDLQPGDENYSLTVIAKNSKEEIGTVPITQALAVGKTFKDTITVQASYDSYPGNTAYVVRENVSGTLYKLQTYIDPYPYLPILSVRKTESGGGELEAGSTIGFGMISSDVTKRLELRNVGGKALVVKKITVPEGYTATPSSLTVGAHQSGYVDLTLSSKGYGVKSGDVVIESEDIDNFTLSVNGTVLDPNKYFLNFEDNKMPAGVMPTDNWSIEFWNIDNNKYILQNSRVDPEMFVTPLLKVAEGEKMVLDCGKRSNSSTVDIYYSSDRTHWTQVKSIKASDMSSVSADGSSWSVTKYALSSFVVEGIPAGNYYIGIASGYANVDNIYGFELVPVAHDIKMMSQDIPDVATVNNAYTSTVTLYNVNNKTEDADNYSVSLYANGKVVATATTAAINAGEEVKLNLTYTPTYTGTYKHYIVFKAGDYQVSTDTINVEVGMESTSKTLGSLEVSGVDNGALPISAYYKNSISEALYTADMLNTMGLKAGDKISSLTYKGYNTAGELNTELHLWIENTEDNEIAVPYTLRDTAQMTNIYYGNYKLPVAGTASKHAEIISVTLPEPLVYTGKSIRIVATSHADAYKNISFEYSNITGLAYSARNDNTLPDALSPVTGKLPVPYFSIETEASHYQGKITAKDDGEPIAGAIVTLTSGDVSYSAVSDVTGAYDVPVVQKDKMYTVDVLANGYVSIKEENVTFTDHPVISKNFEMAAGDIIVEISDAGSASFSCNFDVDFSTLAIKAYQAVSKNDAYVHLEQVAAVPAGAGVIVVGEAGRYVLPRASENVALLSTNLLHGTATTPYQLTTADEGLVYKYVRSNTTGVVGFQQAKMGAHINIGHAYLKLDIAPSKQFIGVVFDDTPTGVSHLDSSERQKNTPMYNLAGQRVNGTYKGIMISNGKKYINK